MKTRTRQSRGSERGKLTRMNLLVNREHLQQLKELYGLRSESEAVRKAAELVLLADEAERLSAWTTAHGGLEDVYGRTTGASFLPHEWPEDEPAETLELEDEEERPAPAATRRRR